MKKRTGAPPGSNNGGGRKKSERELIRRNFLVFKDTPITSAQVREAIDFWFDVRRKLETPETFLDHTFNRDAFPGTTSTALVTVKTGEPKEFTITHQVDENGVIKTEVVENKPTEDE